MTKRPESVAQAASSKALSAALPATLPAPKNYEEAVAELQLLLDKMESPSLKLEESLQAYRRGAELIKYCYALLEDAEQQVKVLEGEMLKPFSVEKNSDAE